jgi:flap endonuclease-1
VHSLAVHFQCLIPCQDVLLYNAPLLRHMTNSNVPLQIIPPSTETGLGLSRSAFVDTAILMGTDFTSRVKKIGPNTAFSLMLKHGSIERMLEEEPKFRPTDVADYLEQVRRIFHMSKLACTSDVTY